MKILAFSDVIRWIGYERIVEEYKPNIICLCGDLASDGFAWIHSEEFFEQIPEFQREFEELRGHFSIQTSYMLKEKYRETPEYLQLKNLLHINKFYKFLEYAGARFKVLLVKGDHDDDFKGDYDAKKINSIPGCAEISGKIIEVEGVKFLGISAKDAHNQKKLQKLSKNLKGQVDIVLMHGENVKLVSMISPKLIIKGGSWIAKCRVNGIPTVFTGPNSFSIIQFNNHGIQEIQQYHIDSSGHKPIKEEDAAKTCAYLSKRYPWITPLNIQLKQ